MLKAILGTRSFVMFFAIHLYTSELFDVRWSIPITPIMASEIKSTVREMSRPKYELKALQALRGLEVFFNLANLETPLLDRFRTVDPPPSLSYVVRLVRQLAMEQGLDWGKLSNEEQERFQSEAVRLASQDRKSNAPSREECIEEVFHAVCDEWRVQRAHLISAKRIRDFEAAIPGPCAPESNKNALSEHDNQIILRRLRAGALTLNNHIFIFTEDDRLAKLELLGLVVGVRAALGRIADDSGATLWLIDPPFRVDVIRRRPGHNVIDTIDTTSMSPWSCFLTALSGVQPARIMRCPVCQKLFPTLRDDQKACTKPCANVHRVRNQRNWYERHRNRYKLMGLKTVWGAERRRLVELNNVINPKWED